MHGLTNLKKNGIRLKKNILSMENGSDTLPKVFHVTMF